MALYIFEMKIHTHTPVHHRLTEIIGLENLHYSNTVNDQLVFSNQVKGYLKSVYIWLSNQNISIND